MTSPHGCPRLLVAPSDRRARRIAAIVERLIFQRTGLSPVEGAPSELTIRLDLAPGLNAESFQIADGAPGEIVVRASDHRGLLYGAGKLLRTSRLRPGRFEPGTWRGRSAPALPVRGIYFATHFHNFYHDAPIEDVRRYVEDLALWGVNAVSVWFDMHHYRGMSDPAAQAMVARLNEVLGCAKDLGLATSLTSLANEGWADSPESLRADWTAGHDGYHHPPGGHYHVEICPSKPGGLDRILEWAGQRLDAFSGVSPDYLWIWPYDQGGCTCSRCAPWGANGFLRCAEPIAKQYKGRFPKGKVVLSTWYFDHFIDGEWAAFDRRIPRPGPDWIDYLLVDDCGDRFPAYPLAHGAPGGFPMVNFSEISMYAQYPWGSYGANPLPRHLGAIWDSAKDRLSGGFPYSEGIFEDMNKAIMAQCYWDPSRLPSDTLREYIAWEFAPDVADDALAAVELFEVNQHHLVMRRDGRTVVSMPVMKETRRERDLVESIDARLDAPARASWRWRIFLLRGIIDDELARHGGDISGLCQEAFDELRTIYHAANAEYAVRPLTATRPT